MIAVLRLMFAVFMFLAAALSVLPPPTYFLWIASIAAAEWGHILALVALLTFLPGWGRTRVGKFAALIGALAFILALSPIARALPVATGLPVRMETAFGRVQPRSLPGAAPRSKPFSLVALVRKPASPEVRLTTIPFVVRDGKPLELDLYRRDRTLPAATEDVNTAIDYLKSNAKTLGIDSTRIALIGRSAGGQLALLSAYTRNDGSIRGVVGFYPPTDQKWGWDHPTNPRVYNSVVTLREFLNGDSSSVPEAYRESSPLNFAGPKTVPTLLIHGTMDPLVSVRQSARLDSALVANGRPHVFLELPWATHGCDYVFNGPCGQISTFAIERFLGAVLR